MRRLCLESRLALLIGLLFGGLAVVVVPPIVTFDGPGHFYRSLQVARGEFRAPTLGPHAIGGEFSEAHGRFVDAAWTAYWQHHDFGTLSRWAGWSDEARGAPGTRRFDLTNTAIESPVNHLVQGAGMRLAAVCSAGPLWETRVGCLFNLLAYLLAVVAALELLPAFRRGVLLFAVSPLLLIQAASLSHDAINFSLPILLIAFVWRLRADAARASTRALVALFLLACLVALLKPVAAANLGCILLLPAVVFGSARRRWITLGAGVACAGALWLGWNLAYRDLDIALAMDPSRPATATAEMKQWFLHHPFSFLPVFGRFLTHDLWEQWPVFFGDVGGWLAPASRRLLAPLSCAFLIGLVGAAAGRERRDPLWSGGLAAQAFVLLFGTCLVCWVAIGTVGLAVVPGLGGRYLPLVYLPLLAAALTLAPAPPRIPRNLFFLVALAADLAGLCAILFPTARGVWG